jgi:hypothetical protein
MFVFVSGLKLNKFMIFCASVLMFFFIRRMIQPSAAAASLPLGANIIQFESHLVPIIEQVLSQWLFWFYTPSPQGPIDVQLFHPAKTEDIPGAISADTARAPVVFLHGMNEALLYEWQHTAELVAALEHPSCLINFHSNPKTRPSVIKVYLAYSGPNILTSPGCE